MSVGAFRTNFAINVVGAIVPLIIAFLSLQKYWQGGLSLGSLK